MNYSVNRLEPNNKLLWISTTTITQQPDVLAYEFDAATLSSIDLWCVTWKVLLDVTFLVCFIFNFLLSGSNFYHFTSQSHFWWLKSNTLNDSIIPEVGSQSSFVRLFIINGWKHGRHQSFGISYWSIVETCSTVYHFILEVLFLILSTIAGCQHCHFFI